MSLIDLVDDQLSKKVNISVFLDRIIFMTDYL